MLALAAQYLAARDDQHCKEALDILNSGDRHLIEFPDDRMHQLIFLTQISMVSSNYHFYRVNDLQTALREAEKALLLYRELLRDHCPRLNSPTT
jgi:hypothetical protein